MELAALNDRPFQGIGKTATELANPDYRVKSLVTATTTVGVISCLKATTTKYPPKEDLSKIKHQVDGQEKVISMLKEELDRRDREMKAAQQKM